MKHHRYIVSAAAVFLAVWWAVIPAVLYTHGTSRGVGVEVVSEPFLQSDTLIYTWSGEVFRSCPVELRRQIIDSENVVTELAPRNLGAIPSNMLGQASYEVEIAVPVRIAEGQAVYQVVEVPSCNWLQRLFPVAIPYPPVEFTVTR